jgi:hypothetical protein
MIAVNALANAGANHSCLMISLIGGIGKGRVHKGVQIRIIGM